MDLDTVLNSYAHRAIFKNRITINSDAPTPNALRRAALRPESSGQTAPARRCETFIPNHIASEKIICIMIYDRSSERTRNAKFEAWSASVFQTDRETRNRVVFTRRSLPISTISVA